MKPGDKIQYIGFAISNKQGWVLDYKQILKISELTRILDSWFLPEIDEVKVISPTVTAATSHILNGTHYGDSTCWRLNDVL